MDELMVSFYKPDDYDEINSWFKARWPKDLDPAYLSTSGFIIPQVAVMFLYLTNSKICYVDFLITNPDAPKELRASAIDKLIEKIIEYARKMDCKKIFCNTQIQSVGFKAHKNGFKFLGNHSSYVRGI